MQIGKPIDHFAHYSYIFLINPNPERVTLLGVNRPCDALPLTLNTRFYHSIIVMNLLNCCAKDGNSNC